MPTKKILVAVDLTPSAPLPLNTYPHRAGEAGIGQRYSSHTCAWPLFVPLLDLRSNPVSTKPRLQ